MCGTCSARASPAISIRSSGWWNADPSLVRSHYEYRTPLSFAVRENQIDIAAFLLDHGADPLALVAI